MPNEESEEINNIEEDENNLSRAKETKREHKQPSYIKDFHCYLATRANFTDLERNKLYSLSSVVSYSKMSQSHKAFSLAISSDMEPKTFKSTAQKKEWQEAMNEELQALDRNQTWDIVTLPKDKVPIGCNGNIR